MDDDKRTYDDPEDEGTQWGRAIMLLIGAAVLLLIAWAFFSGNTPIHG